MASASTVTPLNLHLTAPFNLPVQAASPASLRGVVRVGLPLGFENKAQLNETERHVRLTLDAIGALKAQLEVARHPSSNFVRTPSGKLWSSSSQCCERS